MIQPSRSGVRSAVLGPGCNFVPWSLVQRVCFMSGAKSFSLDLEDLILLLLLLISGWTLGAEALSEE